METDKYPSRRVAPLQYLLRQLNSDSGKVVRGWGTAPLMVGIMLLFFIFLLLILQIANASILLDGVDVDWSILRSYTAAVEALSSPNVSFASTGIGIFFGLVVFGLCCAAFIVYGFLTYPVDQK